MWTNEKKEELKALCYEGKMSNSELAKLFGVPVTEIYAKRSAWGITREMCLAAKVQGLLPGKRTVEDINAEIKAEIKKVEAACRGAAKKVDRCLDRIKELVAEPDGAGGQDMKS